MRVEDFELHCLQRRLYGIEDESFVFRYYRLLILSSAQRMATLAVGLGASSSHPYFSNRANLICLKQRLTSSSQVTPRRVPTSSRYALRRRTLSPTSCHQGSSDLSRNTDTNHHRHDAHSAIPSVRARETRSGRICTGSSGVRPARSRASPTPTPISRRALRGRRILWYVYFVRQIWPDDAV